MLHFFSPLLPYFPSLSPLTHSSTLLLSYFFISNAWCCWRMFLIFSEFCMMLDIFFINNAISTVFKVTWKHYSDDSCYHAVVIYIFQHNTAYESRYSLVGLNEHHWAKPQFKKTISGQMSNMIQHSLRYSFLTKRNGTPRLPMLSRLCTLRCFSSPGGY